MTQSLQIVFQSLDLLSLLIITSNIHDIMRDQPGNLAENVVFALPNFSFQALFARKLMLNVKLYNNVKN